MVVDPEFREALKKAAQAYLNEFQYAPGTRTLEYRKAREELDTMVRARFITVARLLAAI